MKIYIVIEDYIDCNSKDGLNSYYFLSKDNARYFMTEERKKKKCDYLSYYFTLISEETQD